MDKHTQSRNNQFKTRASLATCGKKLSYKERIANRKNTNGVSPEMLSESKYFVVLN